MVNHVNKNSFNREGMSIKPSNLILESPILSEKNTFNSRVLYDNKKGLSGSEEWDQLEAEWQGDKDSEKWGKSEQKEHCVVEEQENEILKDPWEKLIDEWNVQRYELIENQKKLNGELLSTLYGLKYYTEVYNFHTDMKYDRAGTLALEKFLKDYENDQDLKIVLDLRRGESGKTILHNVADFNVAGVYALLEAGADPNIKDKEGKIPLHYAADENCIQAVQCLLKVDKTTGINTQDIYERTPLYYAAEESYEDVVIKLLDEQAKVDIQDKEGNTPLHNAARRGDFNIVELLIEKNPDINLKNKNGDTALHLALNSKDTRVPESILGSKIKGNIDFNIRNSKGDTTLLLTASLAQVNVLREILKQGADIKCVNSEGNTALHYATYNSHTGENCKTTKNDILASDNDPLDSNSNDYSEDTPYKCVDELIYGGIDVNVKNNCNQTPLFFATEANNIKVVKQLLEKGANIKVQDKDGYTAFHYAIKIKNLKMLKALLPCKIDDGIETEEVDTKKAKEILANIRDKEGNTLLHHAVKYGCSRGMLNFLVENGVDINAKNKNGIAPIHIAAKYGNVDLIDFFIKNEADINVQCGNFTKSEIDITEKNFINVQNGSGDASNVIDVKNHTNYKDAPPISIAASNNHGNAIAQLLPQGVKTNIKDYKGWTPIQIAIRTACDEKCEEEEREKAYCIIEKLALFSNIEAFKPKSSINQIINGLKKVWTSKEEESFLVRAANDDERMRKILENALRSRGSDKLPSAPVDQYAPSAPPLDDDFYDKIGSYVKDIPELRLYPNLSEELKELEKSNMDIIPKDISANSIRLKGLDDDLKKISKIKPTPHDIEKLNKFSDKVAKSKDIAELNQVVSEALKSGIRLNFLNNKNNSFTDVVMQRIQELKENSKISSNIICNLVSRGADINSYKKINQELEEIFKDHKTNIQKAYLEANKRISDFHEAVANTTTGKIEFIEIDNTTFYLEYSADSTVDVAKAIEAARGLGLYDGNITFGGNTVKIGKDEVEIETSKGIRNYTDLSDGGDVIVTFHTSLGVLDVRIYNSIQHKDFIQVEVCNPERFNQLVDIKEEIGKNCLFGGLSIYDAVEQGYFTRSGKFQSSETINCKRSEPSEVVSFIAQDIKEEAKKIMEGIGSTDAKNTEEGSWLNKMQGKRNEGCSRVV